ncbi:Gfo/Idh/MocA family protein [Cryptosporangium aurantiacum]|uniref:Predicted dehydrogenase n=1 Tax=Cryptosporangium aurantiacum TaxID=134849 RepID=A0A1M7RPG7_9ACTN|nr:Gfo/Idh/MocA family oxidoreductase [Cryptosporangium aurantiacum]SHN47996.1 Predicted dehydrogenase [Cryptosporangium aurantiacum]
MADQLRVALLGYGTAGAHFHAPLIAAVDGLVLTAVVTSNPTRRDQVHRDFPDAMVLADPGEVWADRQSYDLVVIATPNGTHVPLAKAAVEARLPAVVDKPLASSAGEAKALVRQAEAARVPLTVYQNRRWDGDFRTMRRLIQAGAIGHPLRLESRFDRWRPAVAAGAWKENAADAGGILLDLGTHLVDQALVLLGPVRSVYAEIDTRRSGASVEDDVFLALTHASGVHSHLWASALAGQLAPRFRLLGDAGAYVTWGMDPQEEALRAGRKPGSPHFGERPAAEWGTVGAGDAARPYRTLTGEWTRFYEGVLTALTSGAPMPVDPRDAVRVLTILDAARRSASTRTVVDI